MLRKIYLTSLVVVVLTVALNSMAFAQAGTILKEIGLDLLMNSDLIGSLGNAGGNLIDAGGDRLSEMARGRSSAKVESLEVDTYNRTGNNTAILGAIDVGNVSLRNVQAGKVRIDSNNRTGNNTAILGTIAVGNVDLENLDSGGTVDIETDNRTGNNTAILGSINIGNVTTE